MSEGDKQRVSSARQKVVWAIIGLLVVFFAFLIINAIYNFLLGLAVQRRLTTITREASLKNGS